MNEFYILYNCITTTYVDIEHFWSPRILTVHLLTQEKLLVLFDLEPYISDLLNFQICGAFLNFLLLISNLFYSDQRTYSVRFQVF